jgi:hypothetical protein
MTPPAVVDNGESYERVNNTAGMRLDMVSINFEANGTCRGSSVFLIQVLIPCPAGVKGSTHVLQATLWFLQHGGWATDDRIGSTNSCSFTFHMP